MNERTENILEATIQEFIDTGEPVSSGWLYEKYNFGIKPAMIRLELDALEGAGYLEQPYHSAGRIPTDNGYEFYAARALAADWHREIQHVLRDALEKRGWPDILHQSFRELGLLSVVVDSMQIYKTGLEALITHLDWADRNEIRSVIHDFETVDERVPDAAAKIGEGLQVFIGKKSPVTESETLSVIGGNYKVGDATISIFAIGPKRMDYKKIIKIFKSL
jgi:transcriptional regulator of heat shock response